MLKTTDVDKFKTEIESAVSQAKSLGIEDIYEINAGDYTGYFRRPTLSEADSLQTGTRTVGELMKFSRDCLIYPDKETYNNVMVSHYGLATHIANELMKIVDYGVKVTSKKL